MGQAFNKLPLRGERSQANKQKEDLSRVIQAFLDKQYPNFEEATKEWDENHFIHVVHEVFEAISGESGAIQLRLPKIDDLKSTYNKVHVDKKRPLNKNEFQKIMKEVITFGSLHIGQGGKDIFLYIFGVPVVALFAKRIVPGPTVSISDDIFISAVTSGTVYFLAKNNRL